MALLWLLGSLPTLPTQATTPLIHPPMFLFLGLAASRLSAQAILRGITRLLLARGRTLLPLRVQEVFPPTLPKPQSLLLAPAWARVQAQETIRARARRRAPSARASAQRRRQEVAALALVLLPQLLLVVQGLAWAVMLRLGLARLVPRLTAAVAAAAAPAPVALLPLQVTGAMGRARTRACPRPLPLLPCTPPWSPSCAPRPTTPTPASALLPRALSTTP